MEVHAHTHTARKKWTHYFWEFLMLFLAVFCGFLAEYQLEHVIEHKRSIKYIHSLAEDLGKDTSELQEDGRHWNEKRNIIDTLREELYKPVADQNPALLYKLANSLWRITTFIYSDRTVEQLRHSGEFRLLNKDVVNKLIEYDGKIRTSVRDREAILIRTYGELIDIQNNLFDSRVFTQLRLLTRSKRDSTVSAKSVVYIPLVNNPEKSFLYLNKLFQYQNDISAVLLNESQANYFLTDLLDEIKKHYTIKQ
jgi:hypothetical protein